MATVDMTGRRPTYTATAIGLHWLVFALVVTAWILGPYMVDLPLSPQKLKYFSWHKWIGVTIFLLAVARMVWRRLHPAPPPPPSMPPWQRKAASISYMALYLLILVIPLTGWLYSSAAGVPTVYLGWIQLPDLVSRNKPLADILQQTHVLLNWTLFVTVCVHVAAALKHHFVDRDEVLERMLPFLKATGDRP